LLYNLRTVASINGGEGKKLLDRFLSNKKGCRFFRQPKRYG